MSSLVRISQPPHRLLGKLAEFTLVLPRKAAFSVLPTQGQGRVSQPRLKTACVEAAPGVSIERLLQVGRASL
jgi:hypothetical protein